VVEFRILGPLEVLEDERPFDLGAHKQRTLLLLLLLDANRVSRRELFLMRWALSDVE
jgi:DNA-binding SARP family transcriptional activator